MNKYLESHPFWGLHAPLTTFANAALIVLSSSRLAFGLIIFAAILVVYLLSTAVMIGAKRILPDTGFWMAILCLSSFISVLFFLLMALITPLLLLELSFIILLVPLSFIHTDVYAKHASLNLEDGVYDVLIEAVLLGALIIGLALIREPLGFGVLSVPGSQGIIEFVTFSKEDGFLNRIISSTSGALILLGYGTALFRKLRSGISGQEGDE